MKTKEEILSSILDKKDYCVSAGFDEAKLVALTDPLVEAVNQYFAASVDRLVANNIVALSHYGIRAGIVTEESFSPAPLVTTPKGWDNVTEIFIHEDIIPNTSNEEFKNSIHEKTVIETGLVIYESTLVSNWIDMFTQDKTLVPNDLKAIATLAGSLQLGDSVKDLLEPAPIIAVKDIKVIAREIYIDRKYKELIQEKSLEIFVPSYL